MKTIQIVSFPAASSRYGCIFMTCAVWTNEIAGILTQFANGRGKDRARIRCMKFLQLLIVVEIVEKTSEYYLNLCCGERLTKCAKEWESSLSGGIGFAGNRWRDVRWEFADRRVKFLSFISPAEVGFLLKLLSVGSWMSKRMVFKLFVWSPVLGVCKKRSILG